MVGRRLPSRVAVALACAIVVTTSVMTVVSGAKTHRSGRAKSHAPAAHAPKRPNIVFILTDDLSWNLINSRFAPHIVQLEK